MTVAVPSATPPGPVTVTVAPGSPVPVTMLPVASRLATGASGAVLSGAATTAGGEALPAASVWTTDSVPPFACAGVTGTVKRPSAPTVPLPIAAPPGADTVTVAPGSPVPVTCAPSADTLATGAAGAVRSGAVRLAGDETLPAGSAWVTDSGSPFAWGAGRRTVKLPSAATGPVASTPPGPVTVTVAPASPVPVTTLPVASSDAMGAAGALPSGAITVVGGETLPPGSVWTTESGAPAGGAVIGTA